MTAKIPEPFTPEEIYKLRVKEIYNLRGLDVDPPLYVKVEDAEAYAQSRVEEALEKALTQMCDPVYIEGTINNFSWATNADYARAYDIWRDMVGIVRALKKDQS